MLYLMNSAMMPSSGYYLCMNIPEQAVKKLFNYFVENRGMPWSSCIGYEQNAEILGRMLGVEVPVSRAETKFQNGDVAIVMKLKYRVGDPATKGKQVSPGSFEFFFVKYTDSLSFIGIEFSETEYLVESLSRKKANN